MSRRENPDDRMNAIERDRYERRMAVRRKSMFTNIIIIGVIVVIVAAIIIVAVSMIGKNNNSGDTKEADSAATTATVVQPAATSAATQQATQSGNNSDQQSAVQSYQQEAQAGIQYSTDVQLYTQAPENPTTGSGSGSAQQQGSALHYYAAGQTSYGYDWTYSGGGGIVSINCTYDFNTKQYDFSITGVSEGTTSFTLYYNTADGVQVPVPMTVSVDSNLNVTQIG